MSILYYECFAGISGDMNLGAMIDLGVEPRELEEELSKLGLNDEFDLKIYKSQKLGITGIKVDVILKEASMDPENETKSDDVHHHEEAHDNQPHDHHYNHHDDDFIQREHHHHHHHHHLPHRNIHDIQKIIEASQLGKKVKETSMAIFMRVAEAEAKVHGKPIEEVHFHEVGATDSIVDIVGAAICYERLGVEKVISSPVQLGGGFVHCAHGVMPVPAPATAEILHGIPIRQGLENSEMTTPTGAAIITEFATEFTENPEFMIEKTAYGLGNKDFHVPNALRVSIVRQNTQHRMKEKQDENELDGMEKAIAYMCETNIDDMNSEIYSLVEEKLFALGASDVYKTPIIMKKSRPAIKLSVLCEESLLDAIQRCILEETSSLGVRVYPVEKTMLRREEMCLKTLYGDVRVKKALYEGKCIKYKPEFEDCRKIALEHGVSYDEIYKEVVFRMEEKKYDE